jgi:hypothetical protein
MEQTHNPFLTPGTHNKSGAASIETPSQVTNIAWQTRERPPTAEENALADALQALFAEGIADLPSLALRLQSMLPPPSGAPAWSEAVLAAELKRLGR